MDDRQDGRLQKGESDLPFYHDAQKERRKCHGTQRLPELEGASGVRVGIVRQWTVHSGRKLSTLQGGPEYHQVGRLSSTVQ